MIVCAYVVVLCYFYTDSMIIVMVQRSMEDRVSDPLKPSELTATLIQEPCSQTMKWGVELKVTLRAVEVKPNIPRVIPRPKDMIDEEMKHLKEKLKLLGKKSEEVKKTLKEKEDEVMKEEHDLDGAIVSYGYGRGEDGGAGLNEIRLRQMFYSADEHSDITRKIKRRKSLTEIEKAFMADARIDPCATIKRQKGYSKTEEQKLLHQLNINFPGIDDSVNERTSSIEGMDIMTTTRSESDISTLDESPIVKASLSMAKSLDLCFHPARPTVPKVEQQMRHTITEGMKINCSISEYKSWCLEMGEKLTTIARSESNSDSIKSIVSKMQSVIAKSVTLRPGMSLDVDVEEEEGKVDEEDKCTDLPVEHSELVEWVAAVASQLEGAALELDDDEESLAHDDDKSFNQSVGKAAGDKASSKLKEGGETKDSTRPSPLTISSIRRGSSDQDVWDKVLSSPKKGVETSSPSSNSRRRLRSTSSVSSIREALPSRHKSKKTKSKTSSSFSTLVYFVFIAAMFIVGAVIMFELYQSYWLSSIEEK